MRSRHLPITPSDNGKAFVLRTPRSHTAIVPSAPLRRTVAKAMFSPQLDQTKKEKTYDPSHKDVTA